MSNVSPVTSNFFAKASENNTPITLASTVSPGATTVPLNGASANYSDGDVVVFTVDAGTNTSQVFTGQMSAGNVINVVWTRGNNQTHAAGSPVVDNITATHWNMAMKGILVGRNQDGTLKNGSVQGSALASNSVGTNNISAGAVTANQLAANAVSNTSLTVGTITQVFQSRSTGVTQGSTTTPVSYNGFNGTHTFNAISGHRYEMTLHEPSVYPSATTNTNVFITVLVNGTQVGFYSRLYRNNVADGDAIDGSNYWTATSTASASVTLQFYNNNTNGGTWNIGGNTIYPAFFVVKDIT